MAGWAGYFDGSTNAVPLTSTFGGLKAFAVSLWMKTTDSASNGTAYMRPTLFGKISPGTGSGDFVMTINNGYVGFFTGLTAGTDSSFLSSTLQVNDNKWHNMVLSDDGSNATLYVDGVPQGSDPAGLPLDSSEPPAIGAGYGGGSSYYGLYQGLINNVRFYNRGLPAAEIHALYSAGD